MELIVFKILIKYFVKFFDSAAHSVLNIWPKHLFVSVAERLVIVQINLIVYYEGNLGNGWKSVSGVFLVHLCTVDTVLGRDLKVVLISFCGRWPGAGRAMMRTLSRPSPAYSPLSPLKHMLTREKARRVTAQCTHAIAVEMLDTIDLF